MAEDTNEELSLKDIKLRWDTDTTITIPKPKWSVKIGSINYHTSEAPNAFYRFMQKLVLGFKWERL